MNIKNRISLFRKIFYGFALLTLVFGSLNVSTAQAQKSAGTQAGAIVSLSTDQTSFGAAENVVLHVSITNPTGSELKILKWLTPVNGVVESLFTVSRDGVAVNYLGMIAKRAAPTDQDYIVLAAGETLVRDVDLATYYDLSVAGNYVIKYNVTSMNLYDFQSKNAESMISNMVALSIAGHAAPVLEEVVPLAVTGSSSFVGCTGTQQSSLVSARDAASTYANNAVSYFSANRQGARYTTWFGVYNASRYSTVASHYTAVRNAVDTANPMTFDCTCAEAGVYAYVYPNQPYIIHLCPVFWSAATTGTDSKAGTLIHEITHFTVVAGTDDFAYGQTLAQALAINNPANAIMNADSHEYFAENNPALETVPYTFGDVPDTYWAWNFIERLYKAGITGGCTSSPLNYCPDSTVTRAQMAVFLLKGMHGAGFTPPAINGSTGFGDVALDHWAAAWIKQLAAEGITSGCGNGNYCPESTVTRAQMAIFLLKAKHGSGYVPGNAVGVFSDVPVGYWADKWIEQLAAEAVTSGCGAGIYCPDNSVTRAEMAVFLVKNFGLP